ncbi:MAG: hypothetical protein RR951_09310 [Ruthenibacterium sp.]
MKRVYALVFLAVFALSGCGARGGAEAVAADDFAQETPQVQGNEEKITVGDLFALQETCGGGHGVNTGDAYYEYARVGDTNDSWNALILKTDYATGAQSCICQKPGCTHSDESCNAFLQDWAGINLSVVNDKIYLCYAGLGKDIDPEQTKKEREEMRAGLQTEEERRDFDKKTKNMSQPSYLDVISMDGMEKHRLTEFSSLLFPSFRYSDGEALYGISDAFDAAGIYSAQAVRVDLKTGEMLSRALQPEERIIGVFGNRFVTERLASPQDLAALGAAGNQEAYVAALQSATKEFSAFDFATGEREKLMELPYDTYTCGVVNNSLLYGTEQKESGGCVDYQLHDFATGTNRTIITAPPIWFTMEILQPQGAGKPEQYSLWYDGPENHLLELATGKAYALTMPAGPFFDGTSSPRLMAQTNDGRFLVTIGSMSEQHNDRSRYALLSPENFLANKADYTEVTMYKTA